MNIKEQLEVYAKVLVNEPMRKHTTFHIGGTVAYYVFPHDLLSLMEIIRIANENDLEYYVIGRGSNLLWTDEAKNCLIINLDRTLNNYYFQEDGTLVAMAGCSIIHLSMEALKHSLSGLEFASGIPGSLGGCLYMNAGAYQSDMSNIVREVCVLKEDRIEWMDIFACEYGYRTSIFQKHSNWVILAARLSLVSSDKEEIKSLMDSRRIRRMNAQPLDRPCAGSIFRNPEEMPAWKIVEELGLRGYQIGGAQVSTKHCNFIVNANNEASAKDVLDLIALIKSKAKEVYGIDLHTELENMNC